MNDNAIPVVLLYVKSCVEQWQIKGLFAAIGAAYSSTCSGNAYLLAYVYVLMMADIVFGLYDSFVNKEFCVDKLQTGVIKFLSYSISIVLMTLISASIHISIGTNLHICDFFMSYLIACEGLSIIRHMERLGWPVPELVANLARKAKEKTEHLASKAIEEEKKAENESKCEESPRPPRLW